MIPILDEKNKRIIEFIKPAKRDKILVVGTGVFPKIEFFLYKKFKCKSIVSGDIDEKNIKNGGKILPVIKFIRLDAQKKFPFNKESFDKVIFTEVLEHLKNERRALKEICRVLKKNGKLILSVPKRRWFSVLSPIFWVQHKREYDEGRIKKVLNENGLEVEKMFVGGDYYDLINLWVHLIFKHIFKKLHINPFFRERIDKTYRKKFKGRGTDIIVLAEK